MQRAIRHDVQTAATTGADAAAARGLRAVATALVVASDRERRYRICRAVGSEYPVLAASGAADALRVAADAHPDAVVFCTADQLSAIDRKDLRLLASDPRVRRITVLVQEGHAAENEAGETQDVRPTQTRADWPRRICLGDAPSPERVCEALHGVIGRAGRIASRTAVEQEVSREQHALLQCPQFSLGADLGYA